MAFKTRFFTIVLSIIATTFFVIACTTDADQKASTTTNETVETTSLDGEKSVNLNASTIFWKGYKIIGNHTGTVDLTEGHIGFDNGKITKGKFVVNMNSVKVTDLMDEGDEEEEEEEESPEEDKNDLANHLMDADFFDAASHPTASFAITESTQTGNDYHITGDMTIKGVTNEVSFQAQLVDHTFKATIPIDRTKYGIKYGSGSFFSNLGDNVIKDKFDLEVSLVLS